MLCPAVGCSIIPYTKMFQVWSPVRAHTWGRFGAQLGCIPGAGLVPSGGAYLGQVWSPVGARMGGN